MWLLALYLDGISSNELLDGWEQAPPSAGGSVLFYFWMPPLGTGWAARQAGVWLLRRLTHSQPHCFSSHMKSCFKQKEKKKKWDMWMMQREKGGWIYAKINEFKQKLYYWSNNSTVKGFVPFCPEGDFPNGSVSCIDLGNTCAFSSQHLDAFKIPFLLHHSGSRQPQMALLPVIQLKKKKTAQGLTAHTQTHRNSRVLATGHVKIRTECKKIEEVEEIFQRSRV